MEFTRFFYIATEHRPYPYQVRLAEAAVMPTLLRIPTGAGKTEAAILGWMYRLFRHPDQTVRESTPRRLVYCLPMRTLVEQTMKRTEGWLDAFDIAGDVNLVTLMGGEPDTQWYLEPEKPSIVIGTQDMLLSRALNRGYGNNPFMWPVEYGLLNNDCLWVMDEVQLMENGLPTSTQLAGLRQKLGVFGPSHSMWMSATVKPDWLGTIDHPAPDDVPQTLELQLDDLANPNLEKRHNARKIVSEESAAGSGQQYARNMASLIAEKHVHGTLTLAIVNTVERAQSVYGELNKIPRRGRPLTDAGTELVHSRFRLADRQCKHALITNPENQSGPDLIVVATQAVEAGVDISAKTLITEIAPWASMVQRFGRCNRAGEFEQGNVFWVDVGDQNIPPYDLEDVTPGRDLMKALEGGSVGPSDLEGLRDVIGDAKHRTVIRRRDVIGLFDTTPDLSGSYLDVSQYVRGGEERNVTVFWREIPKDGPGGVAQPNPTHSETVSVPIGGIVDYLKPPTERRLWSWDFLDDQWRRVRRNEVYPGMTLMLDASKGGYSNDVGWLPSDKRPINVVIDDEGSREDGMNLDPHSQGPWIELSKHCRNVESQTRLALESLSTHFVDPGIRRAVELAALFHDTGKAHPAFQAMLRKSLPEGEAHPAEDMHMAKSPGRGKNERRHFRHEVGSALAVLQHADNLDNRTCDLAAYLAAAHHGKVRLGMRSLPGRGGRNPVTDYLLGYSIAEPETLPSVDLGDGLRIAETELDMSIARIGVDENGQRSWLDRTLDLLYWLGPFRLAYLEAIVRAADMRASKIEREITE